MALGIKVYAPRRLAREYGRYVLRPRERQLPLPCLVENMAFKMGRSIHPSALVEWLETLDRGRVELIVAPDALREPGETLRLHRIFLECAREWMVERALAVVQEFNLSRVMDYVGELIDMGFTRVAIPSDNLSALKLIPKLRDTFEWVHVLGAQNIVEEVMLADSIDFYC
ncbi:MAG: hypothetical protein DRJ96_07625 [Thermoprotei archaeon]|nr:MAG: hypothetical protein DRJ67_08625 [Thermoprotei archaeon]RLE95989.1 MAG: hypothetical protein DRJ96_07625 [Thermoprotei archaeon]